MINNSSKPSSNKPTGSKTSMTNYYDQQAKLIKKKDLLKIQ